MNQTFSGSILLGAVLLFTIVLYCIGLMLTPKTKNRGSKIKRNKQITPSSRHNSDQFRSKPGAFSSASSKQLLKLKKMVSKNFPDFTATLREHHLVLERNAKKVAMLTLDVNAALGRRRLGEVAVINFHNIPSIEELKIELSGV